MTKKQITRAQCRCEFDAEMTGSVLKKTVDAQVHRFRTHLIIDSPEPEEEIAQIIRLAKRGCWAEKLVANPIPLLSTYTVNGKEIQINLDD